MELSTKPMGANESQLGEDRVKEGDNVTNRVTVEQAAKELGLAEATVRYYMELGKLPLGEVLRRPGCRRRTYVIYRNKLDAVLGRAAE